MKKNRWLALIIMLATFALWFSHRTALTARAYAQKVVIDGRVVDESDKGIPAVTVTLWRHGQGVVGTHRTGPDGHYHFDLDTGATVDVSYVHSLLGAASVNQLSGFENHRIGPVIFADRAKISAIRAHAELQSLERLTILAMSSPNGTPTQVKEFLKRGRHPQTSQGIGR